jgi:hypothetical protein
MTTSNYGDPLGSGQDPAATGGTSKKEQAQQVAGTAKEQGGHVADVAKNEAQTVVEEAKQQTANLLDQARGELEQQTSSQRDRLVDTLRTFSDDVERMLAGEGGGNGLAASVARQTADRARELTSRLQDRQPGEILEDVRGFAQRRPGTFLLGALAAGVVVGRLARGAKDAGVVGSGSASPGSGAMSSASTDVGGTGTAAGSPTSGVTADPTAVPPAAATSAGTPAASDPLETPRAPDAGAMPPGGDPYGGSAR